MALEEENEGPLKIEDTNMDGYGGKEHREKQKALADKQKEWDGAGEKPGIQVWRIEKFRVKHWPKEEYGTFFAGDSFIVLDTYKEEEELKYNVHFWLGQNTSQDEAGTAAFKTVELDDKLGDLPVQMRQVQGHETKDFTRLFPDMNILEGGVDSGFNKVKPTEWKTRLYHVYGKGKKVKVKEIALTVENLNNNDCFILDKGTTLYNFYPSRASVWEKRGAVKKAGTIADKRHGKCSHKLILDWNEKPYEQCDKDEKAFWDEFGGKPEALPDTSEYQNKKAKEEEVLKNHVNKMYHITNEDGAMKCTMVSEGVLDYEQLAKENDDVLLIDVGRIIYVWIGATANREEISHAMQNAQNFLVENGRPFHTPITRVISGAETPQFKACFGVAHVAEATVCGEN